MSFNIDDPLAGILSDGSDDSFFDDDVLGKKKPNKTKITATPERKKSIFDLEPEKSITLNSGQVETTKDSGFGKSDTFKIDAVKSSNLRAVSPAPLKEMPPREPLPMQQGGSKIKTGTDKSPGKTNMGVKSKMSASDDALDILSELNKNKKETIKSADKGKSSQSLLDDILGGSSGKQSSNQTNRPTTAPKGHEFDFDSLLGMSETKPIINKTTTQNVTVKADKSGKEEKVQKKTKASDDWLGIFNENKEDENVADMPSWLSGESKKKKATVKEDFTEKLAKQVIDSEEVLQPQVEATKKETDIDKSTDFFQDNNSSLLKTTNEDLTTEGAALYLQQQEAQLMVALQLKAQEEKLAAMQLRQQESRRLHREVALAHHEQLDAMLQRQTNHRNQMQAVINAHQERITQRIKALLGTIDVEDDKPIHEFETAGAADRKETPHVREKKQLLQLIQSLQENHDKEIDLMETSYRRQLAFLEISLSQSDERMKEESNKLTQYYSEKITWLEEHHLLFKKMSEDNMSSIMERHKAENEALRQQHLENIKNLQEHHAALMENVKNAVKQEQNLIQDSVGFSSDLRELVSDVKESKSQCKQLVDKVESLSESSQREFTRALQTREAQISDLIQQLKIDRENFEKDKAESREVVNILEKRLKQMTTLMDDDAALMKQKKMEFDFEKVTFNKQTEFAKNVLKRQDEEMKILKEDMIKEYQEKISKINDDKLKAERDYATIAKEKSSIQNLKQELEKMKAELQSQLEEVGEDRLKCNLEKQQLHMEEQRIMAKSRDLDMLAKAAVDKQSHADKKYAEAEFVQGKYEERIRRIQEHVVSLNAREKQIAKEKVALSRERLSLHNERKKLETRQPCSLCRSAQYVPQYNYEGMFPESFHNVSVSRDHGETNLGPAMAAIPNDLVGPKTSNNFDLRYKFDINLAGDERTAADDIFQTMQTTDSTSGAFKDYMDPKFMMLRLDVQQVLSNLDDSNKEDVEVNNDNNI